LDDYAGCDVSRDLIYAYNGDSVDASYGSNPPYQGFSILKSPLADELDGVDNDNDGQIDEAGEEVRMASYMVHQNSFTSAGNPSTSLDYYNYMNATWLDGSPLIRNNSDGYDTTGGPFPLAQFMYPGTTDPDFSGSSWTESTAPNLPPDKRAVLGTSGFTFAAGSSIEFDFVFNTGFKKPSHQHTAFDDMILDLDSIKDFYSLLTTDCSSLVSIDDVVQSSFKAYPNPAANYLMIECDPQSKVDLELMDIKGSVIEHSTFEGSASYVLDLSTYAEGIYLLKGGNSKGELFTERILIQK